MQLVERAHQHQISRTHRPRPVIDRPPADVQKVGLTGDAERVVTVDHGFALSNPALVRRAF